MTGVLAGIDLGGTNIKGVIASRDGTVLAQETIPTESHSGPLQVLARIAELVKTLSARIEQTPVALGIGCPGLVDVRTGTTRFFPNLPTQWRDIPAASILSQSLKCPVRLLNDARAATLGELIYGRGQQTRTMAYFTLGTGVGGGIVIDGELRLGPFGAAGELGHQTIEINGPLCGCGNRGCLETLVSGPAIAAEGIRLMRSGLAPALHELVEGETSRVTTLEMSIVASRDPAIRDAIVRAAGYLGVGVANVITILHPELVVIGGGVAQIGDLLFDEVRRVVKARVGMFPVDAVRIEPALLGENAGVLGAVAWASRVAVEEAQTLQPLGLQRKPHNEGI